jgi:hypothetical protein
MSPKKWRKNTYGWARAEVKKYKEKRTFITFKK